MKSLILILHSVSRPNLDNYFKYIPVFAALSYIASPPICPLNARTIMGLSYTRFTITGLTILILFAIFNSDYSYNTINPNLQYFSNVLQLAITMLISFSLINWPMIWGIMMTILTLLTLIIGMLSKDKLLSVSGLIVTPSSFMIQTLNFLDIYKGTNYLTKCTPLLYLSLFILFVQILLIIWSWFRDHMQYNEGATGVDDENVNSPQNSISMQTAQSRQSKPKNSIAHPSQREGAKAVMRAQSGSQTQSSVKPTKTKDTGGGVLRFLEDPDVERQETSDGEQETSDVEEDEAPPQLMQETSAVEEDEAPPTRCNSLKRPLEEEQIEKVIEKASDTLETLELVDPKCDQRIIKINGPNFEINMEIAPEVMSGISFQEGIPTIDIGDHTRSCISINPNYDALWLYNLAHFNAYFSRFTKYILCIETKFTELQTFDPCGEDKSKQEYVINLFSTLLPLINQAVLEFKNLDNFCKMMDVKLHAELECCKYMIFIEPPLNIIIREFWSCTEYSKIPRLLDFISINLDLILWLCACINDKLPYFNRYSEAQYLDAQVEARFKDINTENFTFQHRNNLLDQANEKEFCILLESFDELFVKRRMNSLIAKARGMKQELQGE